MDFKTEINYEGIIGPFGIEDGRCGGVIIAVKSHNDGSRTHVIIQAIQTYVSVLLFEISFCFYLWNLTFRLLIS